MNRAGENLVLLLTGAVMAAVGGLVLAPMVFPTPEFVSSVGAASVPVEVPDVRGLPRQEARRVIESSSLVLGGEWSQYGSLETMGLVVRQDPDPGTVVPRGAPVSIFWNVGPLYRTFHPESLVDKRAVEAEAMIADWQLYSAGRSRIPHPTVPEGYVVSVSPWRSDSISVMTPVRLLVSTGWRGTPRLTGMSVAEAESLLTAGDLVMVVEGDSVVIDPGKHGRVLSQVPLPGDPADEGDTVYVVVGRRGSTEDWGNW